MSYQIQWTWGPCQAINKIINMLIGQKFEKI